MSDFSVDELKRLSAAATKGPWWKDGPRRLVYDCGVGGYTETILHEESIFEEADDATLVAYLGTHRDRIVALLEESEGGVMVDLQYISDAAWFMRSCASGKSPLADAMDAAVAELTALRAKAAAAAKLRDRVADAMCIESQAWAEPALAGYDAAVGVE